MFTPPGPLGSTLRSALTDRVCIAQDHNFLKGFQMHNDYLENKHFCRWKGNRRPVCLRRENPNLILNPFSKVRGNVWAETLLDKSVVAHWDVS